MRGHEVRSERRLLECPRPDDDAVRARGESGRHVLGGPQAAGDLDPGRGRSGDGLDGRELDRPPRPRPVKIDDVEPPRTGRRESAGDCDGVVAVVRFPLEVALDQSDDPPGPQVDRWQDLEAQLASALSAW
jgi:hypothetical protein